MRIFAVFMASLCWAGIYVVEHVKQILFTVIATIILLTILGCAEGRYVERTNNREEKILHFINSDSLTCDEKVWLIRAQLKINN